VRRLAAGLTLYALLGLAAGEALGVAALLAPLASGSPAAVALLALGVLALTVLPAVVAGHSGVMYSAQLQLGLLYFGLFAASAVLLYLHLGTRTALPPHGTLAIVLVAVGAAVMLVYRRSRYVDTEPIGGARALSRFEKILNPCVSVAIVLTIVLALMELYAAGIPAAARDGAAALAAGTRVPAIGLLALCLLPLVYPLVDVASWQNLAAAAHDLGERALDPGRRAAALRATFRTCAAESALAALLLCLFGAIAVVALEVQADGDVVRGVVAQLAAADDDATAVALPLLLVCALAVAASTTSARSGTTSPPRRRRGAARSAPVRDSCSRCSRPSPSPQACSRSGSRATRSSRGCSGSPACNSRLRRSSWDRSSAPGPCARDGRWRSSPPAPRAASRR
jgi:hypothetical protein